VFKRQARAFCVNAFLFLLFVLRFSMPTLSMPTLSLSALAMTTTATSPAARSTRPARRQALPATAATSPLFCCIDRASHFAAKASMASKARRSKELAHQPLSWAELLGER